MSEPFFSVVVPVFDAGRPLERCLEALERSSFDSYELIVVDDGSSDDSAAIAARAGATVLQTGGRRGPGRARNLGAEVAEGRYLLFLDADCEVERATLERLADALRSDPDLAAAFGSYDDQPASSTFLSQYKNLQHHWVHQSGRQEASTFWSGCGAVKRRVFLDLGGFDTRRYRRPSIEDIELGYRLRAQGHRIRLVKDVRVKHHKRWGLAALLKTDIFDRAVPWTQLMLERGEMVDDLNVGTSSRLSGIAAWGVILALAASFFDRRFLAVAVLVVGVLLVANRSFYGFLLRERGPWFTLRAIPIHWLYYLYSVAAFAFAAVGHLVRRRST